MPRRAGFPLEKRRRILYNGEKNRRPVPLSAAGRNEEDRFMNSPERFRRALAGEPVDRLPVIEWATW